MAGTTGTGAGTDAGADGGDSGGPGGITGGSGAGGGSPRPRYRPLLVRRPVTAPRAAVLVLHGGREHGLRPPTLLNAPGLRMRPFVRALARATEGHGVLLAEARYRHRGWNGDRADAARDAARALAELERRTDGAPVVLVGHSMGGRAALRVAGTAGVVGTVALAPWCPPGEPVAQLAKTRLVMLHATADRITSPAGSLRLAELARAEGAAVCRFELPGGDHAMLRQAALWHSFTTRAVCGLLGIAPLPPEAVSAFALPPESPDGLTIPAVSVVRGDRPGPGGR
ncbi:Predicted esterase [Actinacidiphila alni]|uniref:Predicted esterase n=1 Tax=Actinacidiphila alni TaxID=380248 RepID=A0A1I2GK94_9ACTN|nr:alpha/beta fold hydrolase [Actinacidiphila alni]SFF17247.1 Predicted esterase [Actinacidiphila alni]